MNDLNAVRFAKNYFEISNFQRKKPVYMTIKQSSVVYMCGFQILMIHYLLDIRLFKLPTQRVKRFALIADKLSYERVFKR